MSSQRSQPVGARTCAASVAVFDVDDYCKLEQDAGAKAVTNRAIDIGASSNPPCATTTWSRATQTGE